MQGSSSMDSQDDSGDKIMSPPTIPLQNRFWAKVNKTDGCWLWTAGCFRRGYGAIGAGGRHSPLLRAHRLSWELHNGPIPEGLCVLHECDNPRCVRPEHLFLGTHQDNVADCVAKGRHSRGERVHQSKLTTANIIMIKSAIKSGTSQKAIADTFGVHPATISDIATGRTWTHIS